MFLKRFRISIAPALIGLSVLGLVLAGCGPSAGGSETPASSGSAGAGQGDSSAVVAQPTSPVEAGNGGTIQINGAGASFPFPLYSRWFYEYQQAHPSVKFNYQSIGSGGGISQITSKTVDFGASDVILSEAQLQAAPGLQMLPTVAGAVAPIYNVTGLGGEPLVLDGQALAGIFTGQITRWNDAAIAQLNPGVELPDRDIIVVHRSDGSGTTFIFTSYLSAVSEAWKSQVGSGTSVEWPVGLGGKGNEGVAGTVSQNDGSIGYVELAYAHQNSLTVANLVNADGATVEPSIETTQNAMAAFGDEMPDSLARLIVNAPGEKSWPVAGYTYLLVYQDMDDCTKAGAIVDFIQWAMEDGDQLATDLDYAPLPDNISALVLQRVGGITCDGGKPVPQ